jgi:hypothetical protein
VSASLRKPARVQRRIVVDLDLNLSGVPDVAGDDPANRTKRNITFTPGSALATLVSTDGGATWMAQVKVYGDIGALVRGFAEWTRSLENLPDWLAAELREQLAALGAVTS